MGPGHGVIHSRVAGRVSALHTGEAQVVFSGARGGQGVQDPDHSPRSGRNMGFSGEGVRRNMSDHIRPGPRFQKGYGDKGWEGRRGGWSLVGGRGEKMHGWPKGTVLWAVCWVKRGGRQRALQNLEVCLVLFIGLHMLHILTGGCHCSSPAAEVAILGGRDELWVSR